MRIFTTMLFLFISVAALGKSDGSEVPDKRISVAITDTPTWTVEKEKTDANGLSSSKATAVENRGLVSRATEYFFKKKECRPLKLTTEIDNADYIFVMDGWASGLFHDTRIIVVDAKTREVIFSKHTQMMSNMVKDACKAVIKSVPKGV